MRLLPFAVVGLLAATTPSHSRTVQGETAKARLEVLLSTTERDSSTTTDPYNVLLTLDRQGTLRIAKPASEASLTPSDACPTPGTFQNTGTQVDATVSRSKKQQGSFDIRLVITERAWAGCRMVGDLLIPVFSNRVLEKTLTLDDGGSAELVVSSDRTAKTEKKMSVRLSIVEKP